jgi:superfamily II DNA or RNA helicase
MIQLRDYQIKLVDEVRKSFTNKKKRVILCAPTGSGKTVMFTYIVKNAIEKGGRVLIFTHRTELLKQSSKTFANFGLIPELITANSTPDLSLSLHVSMVETFNRRIEDYLLFLQSRTLIIIDEAHLESFTKLLPYFSPQTYVIGATATPYRKGKQNSLSDFYTDMIQNVDTPDLIRDGYLSDSITYGVNIDMKNLKKKGDDYDTEKYYEENKTYEGVVANYIRLTPNKKTIVFASNVNSSKQVCFQFQSNGIKAKHIDGNTPENERISILEWFANTPNAVICNCGILNAGYDQPDIEVVILYRATTSLPLFLQMCGRGSRVTPTKSKFTILDFGNNVSRHGYWEQHRYWSLEKKVSEKKKAELMKSCKQCEALIPIRSVECKFCGYIYKPKTKTQNEMAQLVLLPKPKLNSLAMKRSNIERVAMCKAGLVKPAYILHQMTNIDDAMEFVGLMGYKKGWLHFNRERFNVFRG